MFFIENYEDYFTITFSEHNITDEFNQKMIRSIPSFLLFLS